MNNRRNHKKLFRADVFSNQNNKIIVSYEKPHLPI